MKKLNVFILIAIALTVSGCFTPELKPVKVEVAQQKIDYLKEVKPILDKRCVSCHSCYNAPCQSKFSSFEGIDRGASKLEVYNATRLSAADPTRLFIDAQNTQEWREKEFFSLTQSLDTNDSYNDSLFLHMIHNKKLNPEVIGKYSPDYDELTCPQNREEISKYFDEKPNHGMPYGFPAIQEKEYKTLASWLAQGAHGPEATQQKEITSPSPAAAIEIQKWESFFNNPDAKHVLSARYLYEHFYLAHWHFKSAPNEFYEIVRSYTPSPEPIEVIPTIRPFDDPKVKKFYYRIQRIHSTIVHKTHMVVEFDDAKLTRLNELFIDTKWVEKPHYIGYDKKISANPFVAYFQIPAESRYKFLLDNSHYIIMTFIRGPVCRGQMALNVIEDHFWVMFKDPKYDITIEQPSFLLYQADNLSMPIETRSQNLINIFSDAYRDRAQRYIVAKENLYDRTYTKGLGIDSIWKGEKPNDAPILTVYRHFNSASVHKGVLGELPKTMWVIDYPQLERIYYSLVAGYDVFGNVTHQTNIRRYMDFLRAEGELNFIAYMPKNKRLEMFKSWYIGDSDIEGLETFSFMQRETKIKFKTEHPKSEFMEDVVKKHILKSTQIKFDDINYYSVGQTPPKMPKEFNTSEDLMNGIRSLTAEGTGFVKHLVGDSANNILVRVIAPNDENYVFSIVINRWHDNVNAMFDEESTLNANKDSMDFIEGSVGSYPNVFVEVDYRDLPDFFDVLQNFDGSDKYNQKIVKYFISRSDPKFWETFDWFQDYFTKTEPISSGLYDLNRYNENSW